MLIDSSYFIGEINIAQLQSPSVQNSLDLFIGKREPEYLELALGYAFAQLLNAAIADTDGRWYELVNGATYVNCQGFTKKWKGLVNDDKESPIANYIYYWYSRNNVTFTTSTGEAEGKSENSDQASSEPKQRRAWNEAVDQTRLLHDFLLNKKDDDGDKVYPEFNYEEVACNEITKKVNWIGI